VFNGEPINLAECILHYGTSGTCLNSHVSLGLTVDVFCLFSILHITPHCLEYA